MLRIITFIAGFVILGFTCYVTMADVAEWKNVHYHLWIIIGVCYAILFGTLLFSKFISKPVDNSIATWLFDWPARCLVIVMLAASAVMAFYISNFNICLIVDGLAVFLYLVAMILTTGTKKHIEKVQTVEIQKRVTIDDVRKASLTLNIVAQGMPDEFATQKKQIEMIKEELRYLSPSSNEEARRLEESILKQLQDIKNDCISGQGILPGRISLINACIAERKNIY